MSSEFPNSGDRAKRKKISSSDTKLPSWGDMKPKLARLSKKQLISCLKKSWDENDAGIGDRLVEAVQKCGNENWMPASNKLVFLQHDWEHKGEYSSGQLPMKSIVDESKEEEDDCSVAHCTEVGGIEFELRLDEVEKELKEVGMIKEQLTSGEEPGCKECEAPNTSLDIRVEQKGEKYRVVTRLHLMCVCNSKYGEPEDHGDERIYYPCEKQK
eukprot:CAMPEP_0197436406 /NCGR_PEP_ID=MMETSP1175-20131217/3852_1 /TAXON_ID=1003142 /ORGANISM="Triceratium dubium, Strain CCMP147" /LENGTH=212 /DNA_ID=CAMNT_0042965677 /DNA_START=470 /DNA_END=1108 /DNA_ORIENTATION=+